MTVVEPISDAERASFYRRVRIGMTLLVGLSAGLVTSQVDPSLAEAAAAVAAGLAVGYGLARFVVPSSPSPLSHQRRRRRSRTENPFADGGNDRRDGDADGRRSDSERESGRRRE